MKLGHIKAACRAPSPPPRDAGGGHDAGALLDTGVLGSAPPTLSRSPFDEAQAQRQAGTPRSSRRVQRIQVHVAPRAKGAAADPPSPTVAAPPPTAAAAADKDEGHAAAAGGGDAAAEVEVLG